MSEINQKLPYSMNSHTCGQLRASDVGKEVILCG